MKDNRENDFRNNKEEDRSKLYVEPGFLKAERTLLKMMLENEEYLQYIEERISENDFILLEHKEIFTVIISEKRAAITPISPFPLSANKRKSCCIV